MNIPEVIGGGLHLLEPGGLLHVSTRGGIKLKSHIAHAAGAAVGAYLQEGLVGVGADFVMYFVFAPQQEHEVTLLQN